MTKWTFEIQWPLPFKQGWLKSSRVFPGTESAANAMAEFLAISADNGSMIEGRLVQLANWVETTE
jgi:hypothetical protein